MPNNQFQFKQFAVLQTGTTLKICTDSCLFGAWVVSFSSEIKKGLDIGTGTGLLALMLAQKHSQASILALEIDETSAELAAYNFANSPWKDLLKVENTSLQTFTKNMNYNSFDLIVCNPPFFEQQLNSHNATKNLAKHSTQLTRQELAESIAKLLSEEGAAFVLLPEFEAEAFGIIATTFDLFLTEQKTVRNKANGAVFRQMMKFEKRAKQLCQSEIVIYQSDKVYTSDFVELLKPYYLYL